MNTRLIKRLYDEACFEKPYPVQYFNLGLPFFIGPLGQSCDKEIIKVTTTFFFLRLLLLVNCFVQLLFSILLFLANWKIVFLLSNVQNIRLNLRCY